MAEELVVVGNQTIETTKTLQDRVRAVHDAYKSVMQEDVHYGVVPGCGKKPTLLKPGAEMLCTQFRLVPAYDVDKVLLDGGHREYDIKCTLTKIDTGEIWAQGVGLATTMESKYRYRWEGFGNNRHKVENVDIADTYNTVLKMAKKRAMVDATLAATGCSDMFTQDIEDFKDTSPAPQENELTRLRRKMGDYKRAMNATKKDLKAVTDELCTQFGVASVNKADDVTLKKMQDELETRMKKPEPIETTVITEASQPTTAPTPAPQPETPQETPQDADDDYVEPDYYPEDVDF